MGLGGSVKRLCLYKVIEKNPFINKNYKLSHYHQYLNVYGGINGSFSSDLSYHLNVTYRQLKNLPRMVVADAQSTTYKLLYNENTHNVVKATGIVEYTIPNAKLNTSIKGTYYLYEKNTSSPIWWYNKPKYRFKPTFSYRPHPKLSLTGSLHLHGSTIVKYEDGSPKKLEEIIDIALGGNYFCSKKFAIFVMLDTPLNPNNTSNTGYPDKKFNSINITGGIQYKW
ncbi:hypothetical protein [Candidatus Cardinium hertigii]|nr:hypothetical protein [Candidatus Cardinium hertigii]